MPKQRQEYDLAPVTDLFGSEPDDQIADLSKMVQEIPLGDIEGFSGHPFKVLDDDEMQALVESIKADGVIVPVLLRELAGLAGKYQLISGHRRRRAAELAGLTTIPAIVREMSDDEATIAMVDSNLQRVRILPSERAWAYRMKLEAMSHQGRKLRDSVSGSAASVGGADGVSDRTVQRWIRLTYLIPELLQLVDDGKLKFEHGIRHSYGDENEQREFYERKKLCLEKGLSVVGMQDGTKPRTRPKAYRISYDRVGRFFHETFNLEDIEEIIEQALEAWFAREDAL